MIMQASEYPVGARLILVTHHGSEYPVQVTAHTSLPDDLIVRWLGLRPLSGLTPRGENTVCLRELKEVRPQP